MLKKVISLSKQSAVYGLGTFLNQGISFFLIPIYTRFLTTADYGTQASVSALLGILAIMLTLSIESAVTRFYYDLKDPEKQRSYFGTVWLFLLVFGLVATVLLDMAGDWLFALIFRDVPFRPAGQLALWGAFLANVAVVPTVMFRVREQPQRFVAFSVSQFLVRILLNIVFVVWLRQGVAGIFRSYLIVNAVYAVPYTWVVLRNMRVSFDRSILRASLRYSVPFIPHRLSMWVLNVSDRILLERFVSLGDLGLYSLGYRFGLILAAVLDAVNMAWVPFYFRTAKEPDGEKALARLITYYMFALMFLTLGNILLSREVLFLVAAPRFHPAYRIVPLISLAYCLHGVYLVFVSALSYVKKTAQIPLYTGISAAVNIGLNVLLIPRYGIVAAAWATFVAFLVRAILIGIAAVRDFPLDYEYRRMAVAIGIALVLMSGWFINTGHLWLDLIAKSALVVAYPLAIRFSGVLYPHEVAGLRVLGRRLQSRVVSSLGFLHGR